MLWALAFIVLVLALLGFFTVKWILILAGAVLVVALFTGYRSSWGAGRGGPPAGL